jgi:hypothetical protein
VSKQFKGFELELIGETNLDERKFPGVTHLLRRDSDAHVVSVIMLSTVMDMIAAGKLTIPVRGDAPSEQSAVPNPTSSSKARRRR